MTDIEFRELLDKYLAGNATGSEKEVLKEVYAQLEKKYGADHLDVKEFADMEDRLIRQFRSAVLHQQEEVKVSDKKFLTWRLIIRVAAVLLLLMGSALYFTTRNSPKNTFAALQFSHPINYINKSGTTKKLIFPDQSFVILQPGSSIEYERNFEGHLRRVNLQGEGFFQVTKNHSKAFIVYTPTVVAKVLGTSFIVKSGENNSQASVAVRTGKVSVYKTTEFTSKNTQPELEHGLIILPNHAAQLNKARNLEKTLVSAPLPLKVDAGSYFNFNDTPVDVVLARLQEVYGVTIKYDQTKMSSCTISVSLGKEDFYQKLNLICRTINTTYVIKNGDILLSGNGCKD